MNTNIIEDLIFKVADKNPGALKMAMGTEWFTNQAGALRYLLAHGLTGSKLWEKFNGNIGEMRNFIYRGMPRGGNYGF